MAQVKIYELRDKTTCFFDPETGLEVTRAQRVEIGTERGKRTTLAIQHGALIEVSATSDAELEPAVETSSATATPDKTTKGSAKKSAGKKSAGKKSAAANAAKKSKTAAANEQPTGESEPTQTAPEGETNSGAGDNTSPDAAAETSQE